MSSENNDSDTSTSSQMTQGTNSNSKSAEQHDTEFTFTPQLNIKLLIMQHVQGSCKQTVNPSTSSQSNSLPQTTITNKDEKSSKPDMYQHFQLMFKAQREKELESIHSMHKEVIRLENEKKERELQLEKKKLQENSEQRFLIELEFVQSLANPNYLYYLASCGLFDNDSFKNYLKYLLYWKKPEYIKYIQFPQCLYFLDLLQQDNLQYILKDAQFIKNVLKQQLLSWKYYFKNKKTTNGIYD